MDCKAKKYLHIYDWNYWWGYYRCCKDWEPFHAAEFSLSEDEAGKAPFFHFDFHNLPALHQTIRDGEFVEPDNPDHPHFLEQARRLRSGEQDWFIGALYYPLFSPEMHSCNASPIWLKAAVHEMLDGRYVLTLYLTVKIIVRQ